MGVIYQRGGPAVSWAAKKRGAVDDKILTLREVAARLGISYMTMYHLATGGKFPAFQVGAQWRVRESQLEAWIAEQEEKAQWAR